MRHTLPGRALAAVGMVVGLSILLFGCNGGATPPAGGEQAPSPTPVSRGTRIVQVSLNDPVKPVTSDATIGLQAAKNEWVGFTVQLEGLPPQVGRDGQRLRIGELRPLAKDGEPIPVSQFSAWQVLPMPVDVNRAGYVRHTGLSVARRRLPRALLPLELRDGVIELTSLRDPARPTDPNARAGGNAIEPPILWIDLEVPLDTPAGEYQTNLELVDARSRRVLSTLPLHLRVYDFVLPAQRNLLMVSRLPWESLIQHYPDRMEAITPRLMRRGDARYEPAIHTLDQLISIAHAHRAQVIVPRLHPTVKWPANLPPQVDWSDFDSVVAPWLDGEMFADRTPLGYWPLPEVDYLNNFDYRSQAQYWSAAATHFDQREWLSRSSVFFDKSTPGRATATEALEFSVKVAHILDAHPRIRATSPLEEDQLVLRSESAPGMIDPLATERLIVAAPGLVFAPPTSRWPENVARPQRWLRTDLPGLVPYVGAGGDERDVRLWAWLAFLRQANMILWDGVLPTASSPVEAADPNQMVWFYPGAWFGIDEPLPTIQLKWIRRAQQDYEYLYLAQQRGEVLNALVMARLITKPVQIQPFQPLDPTYALMTGTTDAKAWQDVLRLVANTILLRQPGEAADPTRQSQLYLETLAWVAPQERPTILGRGVDWRWSVDRSGGNWVDLILGIDLYNASDDRPMQNTLEYTQLPEGWQVHPQPVTIPTLHTYQVRREEMTGRFNLDAIRPGSPKPVEVTFTHGYKQTRTPLKLIVPVGVSDRREGGLRIDGSLDDWTPEDAIQNGPLVQMFTRPTVQQQELKFADTPTELYTTWGGDHFYIAFRLAGVARQDLQSARNFIEYQFRRAWGEDLCQVLIQPVYDDNTLGPVLHAVFKPNGSEWIERRLDPRTHAEPWQPVQGANIRYFTTYDNGVWRGEVAIPWNAIVEPGKRMPRLLRFNFTQHNNTTGQSATWAGPVDHGRDEAFMGLLYLRELQRPGMR